MQRFEIAGSTRGEYVSGGQSVPRGYIRLLLDRVCGSEAAFAQQFIDKDETLCSLCDEHEACSEAIERLADSKYDEALRVQFSELRARLEAELRKYVFEKTQNSERR